MWVLFDRANLFPVFSFITVQSVQYGGLAQALLPLAFLMNLISFFLYGIDKYKAVHKRWRIPEQILLLSAFLGGAAGALVGMLLFRHKTRKWKFRILVPAACLLWALLIVFLGGQGSEMEEDKFPKMDVRSESIVDGRLKTVCAAAHSPNRPEGENKNPELMWEEVPGAEYYVAIMVDRSARNWLHMFTNGAWTTELSEASLGEDAYVGPYPPPGTGEHEYKLYVYALARDPSGIKAGMDAPCNFRRLEAELDRCGVLARGSITGKYGHGDENR